MPIVAASAWLTAGVLIALPQAAAWCAVGFGSALSVLLVARTVRARGARTAEQRADRGTRRALIMSAFWRSFVLLLAAGAAMATATTVHHEARALPSGVQLPVQVSGALEVTTARPDRVDGLLRPVDAPMAALPVRVFAKPPAGTAPGAVLAVSSASAREAEPGDRAVMLLRARSLELLLPPPPLLGAAEQLRAGFRDLAQELPGDGGGLLPGLAIGDTTAVSEHLDRAMKDSSLSHLTAVSGANCAIVTGLLVALGTALGWSRAWRVIAALVALLGFVVLVTPEPSVLRAAVMATIVLVSLTTGRPQRGVPVLAFSVTALLLHDPWLSRDYAFALSVAATAGLLLLSVPIGRVFSRWMPERLAAIIAVPTAAQLACQPILILLEPSIPLYGVPANLLAGPAAPIATVLGSLACVLVPTLPWLAGALAWIAWLPSAWIAAVAHVSAALPLARLPWPEGWGGAALLALLTALVLSVALSARRRRELAVAAVVVLAATTGATAVADTIRAMGRPSDWRIALCDVRQGDAAVVRDGDQVLLVDTGASPALLSDCLQRLGVTRLDVLVLTHFDHDHSGGAEAVLARSDLVIASDPEDDADARLLEAFRVAGATVEQVRAGRSGTLESHEWRVLWPSRNGPSKGNDGSVVLSITPLPGCTNGCLSSLWLGDLGQDAQVMLSASARLGRFDVVKVSHHGSADQHPPLYRAIGARLGLIGVGADNRYGHPAPAVLQLFDESDSAIARTDTDGMILVAQRDDGLHIWRERGGGREPESRGEAEPRGGGAAD
ncbi:ComEC/Rec2 family competence protein [Ruicaihuangia caeni]|uniref:ComEC/Rec2 family competence protein n=1 Tax=Ruicaihuangia caeni TaxID=3042517 RepID=A0AAW6T976_9MICO|nr:ComEC/Rec2 family competence protein [Klugiella sp. YN-L-19]MDI2097920.1 ComEC/Rec2 family competence protein [Klugiella sp. YN-L-19]